MQNNIELEKIITIKYDSIEDVFEREEAMLKTLDNYLKRENNYEFVESWITQGEYKASLNMKIRLKD